jgi:hypothetical protein
MESAYWIAIICLAYLLFKDISIEDLTYNIIYYYPINKHKAISRSPYIFLPFSAKYWPTFLGTINSGSYSKDAWQAFHNFSQSSIHLEYSISRVIYHNPDYTIYISTGVIKKPSPLQIVI